MLQHGLDMDWVENFGLTALAPLIIRAPAWCPTEPGYAVIHYNAGERAERGEESNTVWWLSADAISAVFPYGLFSV